MGRVSLTGANGSGKGLRPMDQIKLTLPDGSVREVASGTTALAVAADIGPGLAKAALAAKINGELFDLTRPITEDADFAILTFKDEEGQHVYWHSASHVLADAVTQLFPGAKPTIGPAIADGFYYDFDVPEPFTEDDLVRIEEKMQEIIDADEPFDREECPIDDAAGTFEKMMNRYKVQLIHEIEDPIVSIYRHGGFVDLCAGPHLPSTGRIKSFKLLSVAGAYWRGDENNEMLQRIYGTARRDHRKLGRELDLFRIYDEAGAGLVYYHPRGAMLRHLVTDFVTREHLKRGLKRGYELVATPHLLKSNMWETSGHAQQGYPMYYTEIDGQSYGIKPMNCPGHVMIYGSHTRSYRDLPIRYFELGTVYRHERVRGFTQDDAHIFCTLEQLTEEITGVIQFAQDMLGVFGFEEYEVYLSTRPEKSIGSEQVWERATEALIGALEANNMTWEVDEGGGAFYGPKIDIKIKQCDFNLPERFDLTYVGEDGQEHRPAMVHRVVLAGIERFLGVLIEECAGEFPMWISPVQVKILPVADRHHEYAQQVAYQLRCADLRVEVDSATGTLGNKIRAAEGERVPYMLIVGDNEVEQGAVAVRKRGEGDLGPRPTAQFIEEVLPETKPDERFCALPRLEE